MISLCVFLSLEMLHTYYLLKGETKAARRKKEIAIDRGAEAKKSMNGTR